VSQSEEHFDDDSPNPDRDVALSVACDCLQEHGVREVVVTYSGSGDSGGVEGVTLSPDPPGLPPWARDLVEHAAAWYWPPGWENDLGGRGRLTLYPERRAAALEHEDCVEASLAVGLAGRRLPAGLRRDLLRAGVSHVEAAYSGSGDSGAFDGFLCTPETAAVSGELEGRLEDFLLRRVLGYDWYNGPGGHGTCHIDVEKARVTVDAYANADECQTTTTRWLLCQPKPPAPKED
jgi:hypothetical protein